MSLKFRLLLFLHKNKVLGYMFAETNRNIRVHVCMFLIVPRYLHVINCVYKSYKIVLYF